MSSGSGGDPDDATSGCRVCRRSRAVCRSCPCTEAVGRECTALARTARIAASRPRILLYVLLTFAIISAAGLTAVIIAGQNERESAHATKVDGAREMSYRIDDALKKALLPLFTMEEMAKQEDDFFGLARRIEARRNGDGVGAEQEREEVAGVSASISAGTPGGDGESERGSEGEGRVNVDGICDEAALLSKYARIASSVKESANMPGVLVNIRLAPAGVLCLAHPLNNTADFTAVGSGSGGGFLDSSALIGHDLTEGQVQAPPPADDIMHILLEGPVRQQQSASDSRGTDARLLFVREPTYLEQRNGTKKEFWGIASVVLNWDRIERDLDLYSFFRERATEFRLLRRGDEEVDKDPNHNHDNLGQVVISESANSHLITADNSYVESIEAFDSGWTLIMASPSSEPVQSWVIWGSVAVLLAAFLSSLALTVILVSKHEHELLLYRMMPRKIIGKVQRGETVVEKYDDATLCFFDIVSFTTISGSMKAEEVMNMLRVLYTEFDRLAEVHGVFNVETIGDAYIVIGGGPDKADAETGAAKVASFALDAIASTRNLRFHDGWRIEIRAGLASGLVVAGVIGTELVPKMTLFGATVILGEALEAGSEAMAVHCSVETNRLLGESKTRRFQTRRRTDGKVFRCQGREIRETYWIDGVVDGPPLATKEAKDERPVEDVVVVGAPQAATGNDGGGAAAGDGDEFEDEPDDENLVDVELLEDLEPLSTAAVADRAKGGGAAATAAHVPRAPVCGGSRIGGKRRSSFSVGELLTATAANVQAEAEQEGENRGEGTAPYKLAAAGKRRSSFSFDDLLKATEPTRSEEGGEGNGDGNGDADDDGNQSSANLSRHSSVDSHGSRSKFTALFGGGGNSGELRASGGGIRKEKHSRGRHRASGGGSSVTSKASSAMQDYWSRVADDAWQYGSVDGGGGGDGKHGRRPRSGPASRCLSSLRTYASLRLTSVRRIVSIAMGRKVIILATLATFAALCAGGLATVLVFADDYEQNLQDGAANRARDADRWLSNELSKSLLPLFAMAELVKDLRGIFEDLPGRVENRTVLTPEQSGVRPFYWRNTTGICDAPDKLGPFNDMAASIKRRSDLGRILVNIQLAPHGVLCLTHPKKNTEDFDDGAFLDTSFAIGLDLINDPTRSAVSRATVKEDRYTIQGPIPLVQGTQSVVDEAIIARYPVRDPDHYIDIDGVDYSFWGHTITLMDWDKLKKKFGLNEFFARDGLEYKMTRTDTLVNETTGEQYFRVAIIAESDRSSVLTDENTVSVDLETADNGWVLSAGYESGFAPPWKVWGCVLVVLGSLFLSSLLFMVLVTTREHELLLYRMMPPSVIKRLQRGDTIVERDSLATVFFSHIVGFTTLSGEMKPCDFMIMLNQIYEAFDRLAVLHGVSKVETIGACYIVTAPGPENSVGREGAVRVALFALDAMDFVKNYRYSGKQIFIQAGIASGPVVSGVIGAALPKYTIFGDTVNLASRMDSSGKAQMIQCSEKTQLLLRKSSEFDFSLQDRVGENGQRGILIKGKGLKYTSWIHGAELKQRGGGAQTGSDVGRAVDVGTTDSGYDGGSNSLAVASNPAASTSAPAENRPGRRVSFTDLAEPTRDENADVSDC